MNGAAKSNVFQSEGVSPSAPHPVIHIDGNAELVAFPDKTGNGIIGDPYVIENLTIEANGVDYGIFIIGIDKPTIVNNCSITGSSFAGIRISSSTNITISNCTIIGNDYGIFMYETSNISIIDNNVTLNLIDGIQLRNSNQNNVTGNNITFNGNHGIFLYHSNQNTLTGNNASYNDGNGISIESSSYIIVTNNIAVRNEGLDIKVTGGNCDGNVFMDNTVDRVNLGNIANLINFWLVLEELLGTAVTTIMLVFAGKFLNKYLNKELFDVERKLDLGYGFFFTSLGIGYGIFSLDRLWQAIYGGTRLLGTPEYSGINRDYILITFIGICSAFIFLTFILEKYILNRKPKVFLLCAITSIFGVFLRPIEIALLEIAPDVVEYIGYILWVVLAIVFILITIAYGKIIKSSKKGSDLWKRSIAFLVALYILIVTLVGLGNIFHDMVDKLPGLNLLSPIILIIGLFIMNYGFLRGKRKTAEEQSHPAMQQDKFKGFIEAFTRPKSISEEEITYFKEQKICLVCKGSVSRSMYICPECDALYCSKCAEALANFENACWACNAPFDPGKPVQLHELEPEPGVATPDFHPKKM